MSNSGYLIYKCRRCGELNKNCHVPDGTITLLSIMTKDLHLKDGSTYNPLKIEIHNCTDGNLGIADLIGFEYDNGENNV